jgi:hypothetical protein
MTNIILIQFTELYQKIYQSGTMPPVLSEKERRKYEALRIHVWAEFYFRQKQDYLDLIENYLSNQLDLPKLKFLFVSIDRRDTYRKANFEQETSARGLLILVTDARAFRFYQLLSELYECMFFDQVNGESFPRVFQAMDKDSFFRKEIRKVAEKDFQEEIRKIYLKMQYLLENE